MSALSHTALICLGKQAGRQAGRSALSGERCCHRFLSRKGCRLSALSWRRMCPKESSTKY